MFHNPRASDHPPVVATVVSPGEACDYVHFKRRLVEPSLLELSVAVRTLRLPFLAVPVGETRRGGYYTASCTCFALAVRDVLAERDGYPNVRLGGTTGPGVEHLVEWGDPSPMLDPRYDPDAVNAFYGFRARRPAAHCGH
ncbi:DUF6302 family protein [Streptomyces sp. MT29]|nr:DUF6302 family protein [Streptomyces sp. MT29]